MLRLFVHAGSLYTVTSMFQARDIRVGRFRKLLRMSRRAASGNRQVSTGPRSLELRCVRNFVSPIPAQEYYTRGLAS